MAGAFASKIISGGQTGVERAALDKAMEWGLSCGGWCPKGRRAEDGPIDLRYPLRESKSAEYRFRNEANVMAADGSLILTSGKPTGGTAFRIQIALKHRKPHLVVDLNRKADPRAVREWTRRHRIGVLYVGGPTESKAPGIYERAAKFLDSVLAEKE